MNVIDYIFKASLFILTHYMALGAVAAVSYLFGRRLTRRFDYHSRLEQVSFSVSLGLGVIAYLILFLGLLGWLYSWSLAVVLAAAAQLCRREISELSRQCRELWEVLKRWRRRRPWLFTGVALAVLLISIPILILPLYPPLAFDGIMYHLPYAKTYVQNHGLVATPYLRFPVAPQTNEMLFTLALLVYDDILAHLIQLLILITLTMAMMAMGRRIFSGPVGWLAGAITLSNPMMVWLGACSYVDICMALFTTMTSYAFWIWLDGRNRRWLVLSGVFCGLAVGVKLSAIFIAVLFGSILIYLSVRERRLAPLFIFGAVSLLVASPWLARSVYYTGNPVFPFFHDLVGQLTGGWRWRPLGRPEITAVHPWRFYQKSSQSLPLLPWNLIFRRKLFFSPVPVSPIYSCAFPLLLMIGILNSRIRRLFGLACAYILFWFFTIRDMRYLAPAIPLLSLATAAVLERFSNYLAPLWKWPGYKAAMPTLFAATLILLSSPGWLYAGYSLYAQKRERPPVTDEQRDAFLTRNLPAYPAYQFLNRLKGRDYTVFALFDQRLTYYADGRFIAAMLAPGGYKKVFDGNRVVDGQTLYRDLKEMDVNYFVFQNQKIPARLPEDEFFKERFKLIYEQPNLQIFELIEKPSPPG